MSKTQAEIQFPVARKEPRMTSVHGHTLHDDYFWMRDRSDPEVRAHLERENAYTEAVMAPTAELQQRLYREMLSHIKETDASAPYPFHDWWYRSRTEEGKQYPIFCRQRSLHSAEEVTLDLNVLAEGQSFMSLAAYEVSDDSNLLAYSTDNTGFRQYTLYIKDLRSGELFPERIEKTGAVAWAADNKTLFYTVEDAAKRQYRLYRHVLGENPAEDELIYEEPDEAFNVGVSRSRSGKYLFLDITSHTTAEARFTEAAAPGEWRQFASRVHNEEYYLDHHPGGGGGEDVFYIRSNKAGRNFSVMVAPVTARERSEWREFLPYRPEVMVESFDVFADFAVAYERENGLNHFSVTSLRKGGGRVAERVQFPDPVYNASPGANLEFKTATYRFNYDSPVTPRSVYDYDVAAKTSTLIKRYEVPGFSAEKYRVERIFATAADGVRVPLTVFCSKDVPRNGSAPLYLYGYGSYGIPLPVGFNSNRLSLLDRGVVIALAHIRGGGDLGKPWHDDGRMMKKMNTFTDFISCAEHLIANRYCDPKRIAIEGRSAGGLLMGAVTNMRPELWRAVVSGVPFVDVLNTMLDASLPLTVGEYEEWGDPNQKAAFEYMARYSPYDNLRAQAYPAILVQTAFHDSQVMYWEPAKYVAKLRTLKTDSNPVLLKTNLDAGHGGASGRYDYLHEVAFTYAFILWQLGVEAV